MSNYPGLKAAVAAGPDALYAFANEENAAALKRAQDSLKTKDYDLVTDMDGDVWVCHYDKNEPSRCAAAYLQGEVTRRRSPYAEPVYFPVCMCHAYRTAEAINRALFDAGFEPFVGCKHLHIRRILEARALNARVTVSPGERLSLAIAERGGLK